jgi:tetratricopeptide (TPR) repeat protein
MPELVSLRCPNCGAPMHTGDYDGAIAPLQAAVERLPLVALAWRVLAACYFQTGKYQEAIRAGAEALRLQPMDEGSAYLVGAAYFRCGQTDGMEKFAHRVARLRGDESGWPRVMKEYRGEFE